MSFPNLEKLLGLGADDVAARLGELLDMIPEGGDAKAKGKALAVRLERLFAGRSILDVASGRGPLLAAEGPDDADVERRLDAGVRGESDPGPR